MDTIKVKLGDVDKVYKWHLDDFATKDDVQDAIEDAITGGVDMSEYPTKAEVNELILQTITGGADLSEYPKKDEVAQDINTATGETLEQAKAYTDEKFAAIPSGETVDLSGYYTSAQTENTITEAINTSSAHTAEVIQQYITDQDFITRESADSNYYTKLQVDEAIESAVSGSGGASGDETVYRLNDMSQEELKAFYETIKTALHDGNAVMPKAIYGEFGVHNYVYEIVSWQEGLLGRQEINGYAVTYTAKDTDGHFDVYSYEITIDKDGNLTKTNTSAQGYTKDHIDNTFATKTYVDEAVAAAGNTGSGGGSAASPKTYIFNFETAEPNSEGAELYEAIRAFHLSGGTMPILYFVTENTYMHPSAINTEYTEWGTGGNGAIFMGLVSWAYPSGSIAIRQAILDADGRLTCDVRAWVPME